MALNPALEIIRGSRAWERHYRQRAAEYAAYPKPAVAAYAPHILAMADREREHRRGLVRWYRAARLRYGLDALRRLRPMKRPKRPDEAEPYAGSWRAR